MAIAEGESAVGRGEKSNPSQTLAHIHKTRRQFNDRVVNAVSLKIVRNGFDSCLDSAKMELVDSSSFQEDSGLREHDKPKLLCT